MTPDQLFPLLAPVRLPAEFAAFGLRDALLFASLGIVTALILWPPLRAVARPRPSRRARIEAELAALRTRPDEARIVGLAALLRRLDPAAPPVALYDPRARPDPEALERAVVQAARRRQTRRGPTA